MKNQIVLYLLKIGVKPHYKGFNYLVSALIVTLESDLRVPMLEIYSIVAAEHGINPKRVERCIRTLITMFYATMTNPPTYRYTNSEFIYLCTMHMKMHSDISDSH